MSTGSSTGMRYAIEELEITLPLSSVQIPPGHDGVGLIARRNGTPAAFVMQEMPAGRSLTPSTIAQLIVREAGWRLLEQALREELIVPRRLSNPPSVTVAICSKDRPEYLARCLGSLRRLTEPRTVTPASFEILVVDNAPSDDRPRRLVESLPGVRYVHEPRPGLDFARNRAIEEASGDLVAFLDDDVAVDPLWLDGLMEAWSENPDAGGFTGLVLPYELATDAQILFERRGGFRPSFRTAFEKIRYGRVLPGNPLYPTGPAFGAGCNMAFRRDVLRELGGFDEALDTGPPLPGGGDLDIFYRAIRAGHALVYEPRFLVFHEHRRDRGGLRRQYWTWGLGFMAFVYKCYRTDPSQRPKIRKLVRWWFRKELGKSVRSLGGRFILPPDMVLAELWGGVVGLLGEYPRSEARVRRIRRKHG